MTKLTSVSDLRVFIRRCLAAAPIWILIPSLTKSLSLYMGTSFDFSFSLAWRATDDP